MPSEILEVNDTNNTAVNNFLAQSMKKVDLRESWDNVFAVGELAMPKRLPYTLMLALMDSYVDASGLVTGSSYFGDINSGGAGSDPSSALEKMRPIRRGLHRQHPRLAGCGFRCSPGPSGGPAL